MNAQRGCWIALFIAATVPLRTGAANGPQSADEVIRRAEERFRQLTDYECMADTDSRAGKKTALGTYHLWFKPLAMIRLHVIRGGHRGSEVAVDRDGVIRGREGGLLKAITIRMSKTDRRLQSIRGVSVTQLDWGSFYRDYRDNAARPGARATLAPPVAGRPYEVTVSYSDAGKRVRDVYRVDPASWTLGEADVFEDDVRVDHILFRDVKLNTGVADSWFRL